MMNSAITKRIKVACAVCVFGFSLHTTSAHADVYKWLASDGRIVYSDEPPDKGAKKLELPPIQTYSPSGGAPSTTNAPAVQRSPTVRSSGYSEFAIVDPAQDVTIWENSGRLSIDLSLTPSLNARHTIAVFLDGEVLAEGRSSRVSVENLDRGTHTTYAVIKDAKGVEVARTAPVSFHLRRQTIFNNEPLRGPTVPAAPAPNVPGGASNQGASATQ